MSKLLDTPNPTNPTNPTDPVNPVDPVAPVNPTDPVNPVNPVSSSDSSDDMDLTQAKHSTNVLGVLKHRQFAMFWFATLGSDIGTWIQVITVGVLVAANTGQAWITGVIGVCGFAIQGIGSPIGGVLADRFDRRKMLVATLVAQTVSTAILAAILSAPHPPVVFLAVLITAQGLFGSIGMPAGQAMMPNLVPPQDLSKAISLGAVSWNAGRILGALFASSLAMFLSPSFVIGINALSYAGLAIGVASLKGKFRSVARPGGNHPDANHPDAKASGGSLIATFFSELAYGAKELKRLSAVRFAILALTFMQTTVVFWVVLVPIFSQSVLQNGTLKPNGAFTSWIVSSQGIGAIVGASLAPYFVAKFGRPRSVVTFALIGALGLMAYSQSHSLLAACTSAFVLALGSVSCYVLLAAVVQRDAPDHSRGRIVSLQTALIGTFFGLGATVAGALGDKIGLADVHLLGGVIFTVGVVFTLLAFPRQWLGLGVGDSRSVRAERKLERNGLQRGQ